MERDSAMASFAFRGSREPVTLLEDSFFRVRQLVPSLVPAVVDALRADPYVSPSTGGIDSDTEYAYCATTQKCHVWRATSAAPTCFVFPVPSSSSGESSPPHCVLLPRPLNASAEPAVLLCTSDGQLCFWNAVSDAFTIDSNTILDVRVPLQTNERITTAARVDSSQALLGTSHARLFSVRVFMHRGEYQVVPTVLSESRGLLGRWFGGNSHPIGGTGTECAISSLVVGPAGTDMHCLVLAVSARHVQFWCVPMAMGSTVPGTPRLVNADMGIHRTLASRILYARGQRYSAADAMSIEILDAAFVLNEEEFVVLYVDRSVPSTTSYGLALIDVPKEPGTSLTPRQIIPLRFQDANDPRPGARPRLHVAGTQPSVAFVSFGRAVIVQLLSDPCGSDEILQLRHGADHILGSCVAVSDSDARWKALTATSGIWMVDFHVPYAQQQAIEYVSSSHGLERLTAANNQHQLARWTRRLATCKSASRARFGSMMLHTHSN